MPELYQLRVVLRDVSPLVWRRLLVTSDTTIAQLHEILQLAFDWSGEHLHRFRIHGKDYWTPQWGGLVFDEDARQVPLSRFRLHRGERFRYEYDFTADWRLDVRLEQALPCDRKRPTPVCTGGKRAAPPEDCGGTRDYLQRLHQHRRDLPIEDLALMAESIQRVLDSGGDRKASGNLSELRAAVDRVTAYQEFQPHRFDRREANRRLQTLSQELGVQA
jgi:Plasmid pRiA4b ORF-3-like protein